MTWIARPGSVWRSMFDRRVLAWLSGWEPQVCAVVTGLITRAHAAGRAAGRPVT